MSTISLQLKPMGDFYDSSNFPGGRKKAAVDDKQYGDTVPFEDIDDFDTQVVDFDDETQSVDLGEETQTMDLAGDTQVLDDYDFIEYMDTQLLDVSNDETDCKNDGQGAEKAECLLDTVDAPERCAEQKTFDVRNDIVKCCQDERDARAYSSPSKDTAQSSGTLRKGFTAVRTASLRAGGHAARRTGSNIADSGSCSSDFSSVSVNVETANIRHTEGTVKGLSNENQIQDARSSAVKLFLEADVAEEGFHTDLNGGKTDLHQLSACENELAGLSYVDSQEPGEFSQANAIEFVDKFLKVNFLESDQKRAHENAVGDAVGPGATAKGPQSVAQQANYRSICAGASVFDWDDTHEDEGGGEFFTKKKEDMIGASCGARTGCTSFLNSRHHESKGNQSVGKLKNGIELHKIHEEKMGFAYSKSKLARSKNVDQLEVNLEKNVDIFNDQELGLDSCNKEIATVATNAELTDMLNVGIDTQVAAEAMEALAAGSALVDNNGVVGDQNWENGRGGSEKESTEKGFQKKSYIGKKPRLPRSDIGSSSKQTQNTMKSHEESKCSVALRTRSQYVVEEFINDSLKLKGKRRRLNLKNFCSDNERESSGILPAKIVGRNRHSVLERELNKNGSVPVKKRSLRGKISSSTPVARNTRKQTTLNHLNVSDDASEISGRENSCLDLVQTSRSKRKHSCRSDMTTVKALDSTCERDGSKCIGSSDRGIHVHPTSYQVHGGAKKQCLLITSLQNEVLLQSVARRTRSKSSAQCAEVPQEGKGLHSREMLSVEVPCQLSSKKHKTCFPLTQGAVPHMPLAKSPQEVQNSSTTEFVTPTNLKTPRSAASPICMGNDYHTPSCKKILSLQSEFCKLTSSERECSSPFKDLRQRRDKTSIRVLFSQHLDEDIIRQQKKILVRLGVPEAFSISEATHFVANMFARTRNMLEAIANGKPVVTHLWLESCGQANCFIDEKKFILRDAKKERELGFCMPVSLARANRNPLLEGRRVLVTQNTKPGKEIISALVKAVHGQAIERLCRSMSKNYRLPDDLLVLSCDDDFDECVPLLEKGIAVYSSELLLSGIITQQLEYERYRIFVDHVKKTRSTLWVKKDGKQFLPVNKTK